MDNNLDEIIIKINNLCKYIKDFDSKKPNTKQTKKSMSLKQKQIAKRRKRNVNFYDEIPQDVLDKSYRIFRSSKLLEQYYCSRYFKLWSRLAKRKQISRTIDEKVICNLSGKKRLPNPNEINIRNKLPESNEKLENLNLNSESQDSFEEPTEDKSKISLNIGEGDYSHENI